ncbi:hypothetical protein HK101_000986, partial [Irineochytrium annulatum]
MNTFADAIAAANLAADLAGTKHEPFSDALDGLDAAQSPDRLDSSSSSSTGASPNDFLWDVSPDLSEAENALLDLAGDAGSAMTSPAMSLSNSRAGSPTASLGRAAMGSAAGSPMSSASPRGTKRSASNLQIVTRPGDFNLNTIFEGLSDQLMGPAAQSMPAGHHHSYHGHAHGGYHAPPAEYGMPPAWPHHAAPYYPPPPCPCQSHHPMTPMSASMPPHHHAHHGHHAHHPSYYPYPHTHAYGMHPPATGGSTAALSSFYPT